MRPGVTFTRAKRCVFFSGHPGRNLSDDPEHYKRIPRVYTGDAPTEGSHTILEVFPNNPQCSERHPDQTGVRPDVSTTYQSILATQRIQIAQLTSHVVHVHRSQLAYGLWESVIHNYFTKQGGTFDLTPCEVACTPFDLRPAMAIRESSHTSATSCSLCKSTCIMERLATQLVAPFPGSMLSRLRRTEG